MLAVFTLALGSCGANYAYYTLDRPENKLLGPTESDDLNLTETCDPEWVNGKKKYKCIVMISEEFYKAKKETLNLRQALKDCQKGAPPTP